MAQSWSRVGDTASPVAGDCTSPRTVETLPSQRVTAPDEIVPAPGVPRTLTGKRVEVPIKQILRGTAWGDLVSSGAVANPEVLDWYAEFGRSRVVPLMGAATM